MLEALSTAQHFLCWVMSGASASKMQRLGSGIIWRFIYSRIQWMILDTNWDLSWSYYPEHLHMASSSDWLGFLIAWSLNTKSKYPKFYHILWLILRSHIASLSNPRSHRSSSQMVEQQTTESEEHVEWEIMLQPFWKLRLATHTMLYFVLKALDILQYFFLLFHLVKPYQAASGRGPY